MPFTATVEVVSAHLL